MQFAVLVATQHYAQNATHWSMWLRRRNSRAIMNLPKQKLTTVILTGTEKVWYFGGGVTNTPHHSTSIFYSIYLTLTQVPPPHPPFALLRRLCAGCPDPTPKPPEHKLNNNHTHYTPTNNITDESLYNHVITHYDYPAPLSPSPSHLLTISLS